MSKEKYPVGSVHGRFQPPHNQHIEYILEAKKRCDFLWIGITQYDIKDLHDTPTIPHRSEAKNNPLTYFERINILREALISNDIEEQQFSFVPFPLESPTHLKGFLPLDIPIFTTICDEWNSFKVKLLEECGYRVIVLFEREGEIIRGKTIRSCIAAGGIIWEQKVPQPSVTAVHSLQIKKRLERYSEQSEIITANFKN